MQKDLVMALNVTRQGLEFPRHILGTIGSLRNYDVGLQDHTSGTKLQIGRIY